MWKPVSSSGKNLTNLFLSLPAKSGNCLDVLGSFKSDF